LFFHIGHVLHHVVLALDATELITLDFQVLKAHRVGGIAGTIMVHQSSVARRNRNLVVVEDERSVAGKFLQEEAVVVAVEGVVPEIEVQAVNLLAIDGRATLEVVVSCF